MPAPAIDARGGQVSSPSVGPSRGWLLLHGGGTNKDNGAEDRFVQLAGGSQSSIVIVLTPIDLEILTPDFKKRYRDFWLTTHRAGSVEFIDTRDRMVADSGEFVAPLASATGVWIVGGHLTTLLDSYLGTTTARAIAAVADRGGVIGGSSAGAMIQGAFLINLTKTPSPLRFSRNGMYLDAARTAGFGLLHDVTIYPHLSARDSSKDVVETLARYPNLLGLGLDEGAWLVVHDDVADVNGKGHVFVFDERSPIGKKMLTLSPGQRFDLGSRRIAR